MRKRDFLAELCWRLGRMVIGKAASGLVLPLPAGAAVLPVLRIAENAHPRSPKMYTQPERSVVLSR